MACPVSVLRDLRFAAPGGRPLHANLYLPHGSGGLRPAIIWVHGGGWRFGSRTVAPDLSRFFAGQGFVMAAVDYRLTPQSVFPAQIHDLVTAILWLRSVADTYAIDPGRIGLWGSSAGGHLSALAALAPAETFEPPDAPNGGHGHAVQAVVVGYAPIDFLQMDAHRAPAGTVSADPETLLLPRVDMRSADPDSFESQLLGAPVGACPDRARAASPLTYAGPGAPPFLILHGLEDTTIPPHQSELLYRGLAGHGNDATLCLVEGLGHGFLHRTHLDDGPVRRMTVRRRRSGDRECLEQRAQPIFPLIEAFFRTHLTDGGLARA